MSNYTDNGWLFRISYEGEYPGDTYHFVMYPPSNIVPLIVDGRQVFELREVHQNAQEIRWKIALRFERREVSSQWYGAIDLGIRFHSLPVRLNMDIVIDHLEIKDRPKDGTVTIAAGTGGGQGPTLLIPNPKKAKARRWWRYFNFQFLNMIWTQ